MVFSCQRPLTRLDSLDGSLSNNQLCGVNARGRGTYTTVGVIKLCEGIKGSAITSLECATQPLPDYVCFPVSLSLLAVLLAMASDQWAAPRSVLC